MDIQTINVWGTPIIWVLTGIRYIWKLLKKETHPMENKFRQIWYSDKILIGLIIIGLLSSGYSIYYLNHQKSTLVPIVLADSAAIRFHFYGDERFPTVIGRSNTWRWQSLIYNITARGEKNSKVIRQYTSLVLFVIFDKPVKTGTLEVASPDFKLPPYEVKAFTSRYAVIVFDGNLPAGTLDIMANPN